jgi:hypothetical protein
MPQELMQHQGATAYVVAALVLFLMVFVSIVCREFMRPRHEVRHLSGMPLEDETVDHPTTK